MNYEEAINYFRQAEKEGYFTPDPEFFANASEEEVIKQAEELGARGNWELENFIEEGQPESD